MKSDPELDALVASLREDLPSEQDSARLRARLSALGLASSQALVSSAAAAASSQGAAQGASLGAAAAGKVVAQAGAVSWAVKAGAVLVATASLAGPVWLVHTRSASVATAASSASSARPRAGGTTARVTRATSANTTAIANTNANAIADVAEDPIAPTQPTASERASARSLGATAAATGAIDSTTSRASTASPSPTVEPVQPSQLAPNAAAAQPATASTAGFAKDDERSTSAATRPAPAAEPTTLREETVLIDGALAALRRGDSPRALSLLSEHQRRFPNGLLAQERERALRKISELRSQRSAP